MIKSDLSLVALKRLISENYVCCNEILSINYHNENNSSNQHFIIDTSNSKYFLKAIKSPSALYQKKAIFRIYTVSKCINELKDLDLGLENIIENNSGDFLTINNNIIYRLYSYIDGRKFDGSEKDIKSAAQSISNFHLKAYKSLSTNSIANLEKLKTPYPLDYSISKLNIIIRNIEVFSVKLDEYQHIFKKLTNEFHYIDKAINQTIKFLNNNENNNICLLHLDFHPENVIYTPTGHAKIIDLDSAMLGNRNKCIAFSILRFSLFNDPNNFKRIIHTTKTWDMMQKSRDSLRFEEIINWMIFIEVEKILRILIRYFETGKYSNFLKNIHNLHLHNLKGLLTIKDA